MSAPFYTRHRGPYRLQIIRPTGKAKAPWASNTLSGASDGEDVAAEAQALLEDPRDVIEAVYIWSVPERQHVMTYRRTR